MSTPNQHCITQLTLENESISIKILDLGCTITSLRVKDKDGQWQDMVLGYETPEEYLNYDGCLGAVIGRTAGRISGASFTLNGTVYDLPANDNGNTLHGGLVGFNRKTFDYTQKENAIVFHYTSPDGEEGFPGTLSVTVTYTINGSALTISYEAVSDKDTLINLTNHAYFNLSGHPCSIDSHILELHADQYAPISKVCVPCGYLRSVDNSIFDFRKPSPIGDHLTLPEGGSEEDRIQLENAGGIDHPFIFNHKDDVDARLCSPDSGITLTIKTTAPQAQVYTSNFLTKRPGRNGQVINVRDAVCVETQVMPDGIHSEEDPDMILRAGKTFTSTTTYAFSAE